MPVNRRRVDVLGDRIPSVMDDAVVERIVATLNEASAVVAEENARWDAMCLHVVIDGGDRERLAKLLACRSGGVAAPVEGPETDYGRAWLAKVLDGVLRP